MVKFRERKDSGNVLTYIRDFSGIHSPDLSLEMTQNLLTLHEEIIRTTSSITTAPEMVTDDCCIDALSNTKVLYFNTSDCDWSVAVSMRSNTYDYGLPTTIRIFGPNVFYLFLSMVMQLNKCSRCQYRCIDQTGHHLK